MGLDRNIYVGSFLKIKRKESVFYDDILICPVCEGKLKTKFCPDCGKEGILYREQRKEIIDIHQLIDNTEAEDYYFFPESNAEYDIALIWSDEKEDFYIDLDFDEYISDKDNNLPKKAGEENFKDIIDILKQNDMEYELHYGVIAYYS